MKKNLIKLLAFTLVIALLLAGCGKSEPTTETSTTGSTQEGTAAPEAVVSDRPLVVGLASEPKSIDSHGVNDNISSVVKEQIYDALVKQDENMEIAPLLAESWEYIDDTTLVMKIRQGVTFHNGDPLTANDVLFSFKRGLESDFTVWILENVDMENTKVIDDHTLEIKLLTPSGAFLAELAFLYIIPEKAFNEMGEEAFAEKPIGTGPFIFREWFRGDRLEFDTNANYWDGAPKVNGLIVRAINEDSSRAIEVEAGGIDITYKISPNDVQRLEDSGNVNLLRGDNFVVDYIGFNCETAPFNDVKVRQAISYAVDKNSIVDAVYSGTGKIGTGPIPTTVWGYKEGLKQYDYNPEKAKELLAEAGYADGLSITITCSDARSKMDTAEILQNQLSQVGITCEVIVLENSTYLQKVIDGDFQIFLLGFTVNTGDADYGLAEAFTTGKPAWSNTCRYSNPEVDKELEIGGVSLDPEVRKEAYAKAQDMIVEDAPRVFLWDGEDFVATSKDVGGFTLSPSGRHNLGSVYFTK